ncbi:MAG: endonuclease III [Deltaproteobacteria bacterium]|nr:endonuclease III [Deltaproteobacteria bacterium]
MTGLGENREKGGGPVADPAKAKGQFRTSAELRAINDFFRKTYPKAKCGLNFKNSYELLMATILSAQCTDKTVNKATEGLFARWPDPAALAAAEPTAVEEAIRICGFFRQKAKSIIAAAQSLITDFNGRTPQSLDELLTIKGVGRKTANVVLGEAFAVPAITVDTHVKRISYRLELTASQSPEQIEFDLMAQIPRDRWIPFSREVIAHGRTLCLARKPLCPSCSLKLCRARLK